MSMDESYNTEHFRKEEPPSVILLVDDNATNLQVLHNVLDDQGYRILVAKSGETALSVAAKNPPAVVLLDINMPGMDGFEVCRKLKAETATKDSTIAFCFI